MEELRDDEVGTLQEELQNLHDAGSCCKDNRCPFCKECGPPIDKAVRFLNSLGIETAGMNPEEILDTAFHKLYQMFYQPFLTEKEFLATLEMLKGTPDEQPFYANATIGKEEEGISTAHSLTPHRSTRPTEGPW